MIRHFSKSSHHTERTSTDFKDIPLLPYSWTGNHISVDISATTYCFKPHFETSFRDMTQRAPHLQTVMTVGQEAHVLKGSKSLFWLPFLLPSRLEITMCHLKAWKYF